MGTPELASGKQQSAPVASAGPSASRHTESNNVVEFDPGAANRIASRGYINPRAKGFVYDGVRAGRSVRAGLSRRSAASQPLPMEEVCFFIKNIDNSDLRRHANPESKKDWAKLTVVGLMVLLVVLASHAPRALVRQSGYQIERLQQRHQALLEINEQLKVRRAQMADPRRVVELAAQRGLAATPPERFAWQDRTVMPADSNALAQNQGPR